MAYEFEGTNTAGVTEVDAMLDTLGRVFTDNLKEKYMMAWDSNKTPGLVHVIFATMAKMLKGHQSKKKPNTACVLNDTDGNFYLGMVMHYMAPDEDAGDEAGNWVVEATFNEDDMGELDEMYDNYVDEFGCIADNIANQIMNARFRTIQFMNQIMTEAIGCIKAVLDGCDVNNGPVSMTYGGVFTASVALENGIKVMSITPGETIKQIIKAD